MTAYNASTCDVKRIEGPIAKALGLRLLLQINFYMTERVTNVYYDVVLSFFRLSNFSMKIYALFKWPFFDIMS